jgi:hypothetical protein
MEGKMENLTNILLAGLQENSPTEYKALLSLIWKRMNRLGYPPCAA